MVEIIIAGVSLVALCGVAVELIKRLTGINTKYLPVISGVVGAILCVLIGPAEYTLIEQIVLGLMAGLGASGGYDVGKNTSAIIKEKREQVETK